MVRYFNHRSGERSRTTNEMNNLPIFLGPSKETIIVPVVPVRDGVVFPHTDIVLTFGRPRSLSAIEASYNHNRNVLFVMQKNPQLSDPPPQELYEIGTFSRIERMLRTNGEINALVKGLQKAKIISYESLDPFLLAKVELIPEQEVAQNDEITALVNHITTELKTAVNIGKSIDFLVFMNVMSSIPINEFTNQVASTLEIKPKEKQELLEINDPKILLNKITELLSHEMKVLDLERKIASKTQEKFDKNIKESILRERLKTIEKELGEDDEGKEFKELREKIKNSGMPAEVSEKANKELKRLEQMSAYNPESSYVRTYLETLAELPWNVSSTDNVEIKLAEKILDEDHYGLKKIKERIIEYLAVMKLKQKNNGGKVAPTILCFVGPPGVGKTSIGKSIARALGRKFVKMSLGGIRDEAEIRGHRRTYVGALPGRIIQGMKDAKTKNPVFMLDEIDKVGTDFRGDPSSALLEALDPEQNHSFSDHYLEVPFDLSRVMFITTCNILDTIPPALKDRLEIIHFPGYTEEEKFNIAKNYLVKKQTEANGLVKDNLYFEDSALKEIIRKYTREAGVRNFEREISKVARKIAKEYAQKDKEEKKTVKTGDLHKFLGPAKFTSYFAEKADQIGMSTGLAWTEAGGDILFIEVALMPGKGTLTLTGHLGEVMKESCQAAMSYVRSRWKKLSLKEKFYQSLDVHVHVPEGAVPKDGPSAGLAIATALISALTKTPVNREIGMTGEITLRGRALEIGGVKEKVIAAHRAGLKTVILPKDNEKDLEDIPQDVQKDLKFIFVDHMDEVLKIALKK